VKSTPGPQNRPIARAAQTPFEKILCLFEKIFSLSRKTKK